MTLDKEQCKFFLMTHECVAKVRVLCEKQNVSILKVIHFCSPMAMNSWWLVSELSFGVIYSTASKDRDALWNTRSQLYSVQVKPSNAEEVALMRQKLITLKDDGSL